MYEAKHALRMNFEGIEAERTISPDGKSVGLTAKPIFGSAANAMEVTRAQEFLDSRLAKTGLFAFPYLGTGIEKSLKYISPTIRGLTSKWGVTRSYMNRMSNHSIHVQGVEEGRARPQNFEALMEVYHRKASNMGTMIEAYRNEANGIGGSSPLAATKRLAQRLTQGVTYDQDQWGREVMSTLFSGEKSDIAQVNQLADELIKYYKENLNLYQRAHGLEERDLPVKTAAAYLSRRYDTDYMSSITGMESWNNMAVEWFREGDSMISEAMSPINDIEGRINFLRDEIKSGVNLDENRIQLKENKKQLRKERHELKERIRENEELQNLLHERITLSAQEEKSLTKKLKPFTKR